LGSSLARAEAASSPLPVLGIHLLIPRDWEAIARNSAQNLQEDRTRLFNALLERVA
jgi:hypothetical protein